MAPSLRLYDEVTELDWDRFVVRWWERRVVVLRAPCEMPFPLSDVFACAVEAGRRQLDATYDVAARRATQFSIEERQEAFVEPWLPFTSDGDFAGYAARLAPALGGRRYALVISGFHGNSFAVWSRARAWFAPLWRRIGLPSTGAITTLFHGDYESTPVGVHKDRFATFMFVLSGRKRMRFWPARPWDEPVSTITQYDAHLGSSFAVDVGQGDFLYWPSSYYHVGESSGGLATSVNVGVPIDEHEAAYVTNALLLGVAEDADLPDAARRRAMARFGRARPLVRGVLTGDGHLSATLPAALRGAVTQLQRLAAAREMAEQVRASWLSRESAAGFEPSPPAARRVQLRDGDRLRNDRESPVLIAPAREDRGHRDGWLCAANGHVMRVVGHPAVPALGRALATGQAHLVADLVRPFGARAAAIRALLQQLVAVRALEHIAAPQDRQLGQYVTTGFEHPIPK
jgi:hypothetical protein